MIDRFIPPPKVKYLIKHFKKNSQLNLLDVGCGNNSALLFKHWLPNCQYHGIDRGIYNNSKESFAEMVCFFDKNLVIDDLSDIKSDYYDAIVFSHVIEHLPNGLEVLSKLVEKLKHNGIIYIEFPSVRSLSFPTGIGTLQFCDDDTHIKVYDVKEVANTLLAGGVTVLYGGTVRDFLRWIIAVCTLPLQLYYLIFRGKLHAWGMWRLMEFSDCVIGVKR